MVGGKSNGQIRVNAATAVRPQAARAEPAAAVAPLHAPRSAPPISAELAAAGAAAPRRDRDTVYRRALAGADLLSAGLALGLSVVLIGGDRLRPASILALAVVLILSEAMDLYDRDKLLLRRTTLDEAPKLFQVATLSALALSLLDGVLVGGRLGAGSILAFWIALFVLSVLCRTFARGLARRRIDDERCLVVGDTALAEDLRARLATGSRKARVVGVVPLDGQTGGSFQIEDESDARALLETFNADRVIVATRTASPDRLVDLTRRFRSAGVRLSVVPPVSEIVGSTMGVDDVRGTPLVGIKGFEPKWSSALLKRGLDIAGSFLGLALALPAFAVIAAAIKLDSRGPVFFWQTRVGRHGKTFRIVKFRTMEDGADAKKSELLAFNEANGLFKIAQDPRMTRVGRYLRRTSLDELPQLWNVLVGQMSLVGPRPLVVDEDDRVEGWQRRRLELTPGMTGHWQVLGASRIPLHEMVEIDYLYVANWSVWTDVKILLRTMSCVVGRSGL